MATHAALRTAADALATWARAPDATIYATPQGTYVVTTQAPLPWAGWTQSSPEELAIVIDDKE
jgi:hypothetical protein